MSRLASILGQQRAIEVLHRAIEGGRLAGAYLFTGPEGVGKATLAAAIASALNCLDHPGAGCDSCAACRKIAEGLHPDFLVLSPDGAFIKIDQVRGLQQRLAFPPHEGRHRVVVIDGAERLNLSSANALLKSVEEPRPDTLFVLVSSSAHQVIPTLRSRCQRVRLQPLTSEQVTTIVAARTERDAAAVRAAVMVAEGSPGRALRLLESEQLQQAREIMQRLLDAARSGSAEAIFEAAEQAGRDRAPILEGFELLRVWLRDVLLLTVEGQESRIIHTDDLATLRQQASTMTRAGVLRRLRDLQAAQAAVMGNVNPRLVLEALAFRVA